MILYTDIVLNPAGIPTKISQSKALLALAGIGLVTGAAFWAFTRDRRADLPTSREVKDERLSDETANWPIFLGSEGFQLKYPTGWHVFPGQPRIVDRRNILEIVSFSNKQALLIIGVDGSVIQGDPNNYSEMRMVVSVLSASELGI